MLKVTVLGCGSSFGVPVIGCECMVCTSNSSYNKRTRSAIIIDKGETKILIDFGFDIKYQLVRAGVKRLDGAILTHDHADHVGGIDNLRIFSFLQGRPLDIFTDHATSKVIEERYKYLFASKVLAVQPLTARPVTYNSKFSIGEINIQAFVQNHDAITSLGIRVDDFVYSSDVIDFPEESRQFLQNIKVWILDCLDYKSNKAHAGLDKILQWNEEYKPEKILLTNMNHNIDYHKISTKLPKNITPLYDGYTFKT